MKIRATHVIGLSVYTVKDGQQLDTVQDVVYDPEESKVTALIMDQGGWFSDTKIILIEDVHSIGEKAVLIETAEKVKKASDVTKKVANIAMGETNLTSNKIITEDGNELGKITDLYFDSGTGMVDQFEVSQGGLKDIGSGKKLVKVDDIITVGKDATIVGAYTEQNFEKQAKQGGMQGAMNTMQKQGGSALDQAVQKARELGQKTQEKVREIQESPKTQELKDQAKEKLQEAEKAGRREVKHMKKQAAKTRKKDEYQNVLKDIQQRADQAKHDIAKETEEGKEAVREQTMKSKQDNQPYMDKTQKTPDVVVETREEYIVEPDMKTNIPQQGMLGGKAKAVHKRSGAKSTKKKTKK